jgi:hypothetical protein
MRRRYRWLPLAVLAALLAAGAWRLAARAPRPGPALATASLVGGAPSRGDVPQCARILGTDCPRQDPPGDFDAGRGPCDEVPATVVAAGRCRARVAGCAGLTRNLCDRVCEYCASIVDGASCRLRSFYRGSAALRACGLRGRDFEWEPVASMAQPVTFTGTVTAGGRAACAGVAPCPECGEPRLSASDSCLTHEDRDFVMNLAVGEEALPLLSPGNLIEDRGHAGRSVEIESEWMYLFAPYQSRWFYVASDVELKHRRRLDGPLRFRDAKGREREVAVPLAGDTAAAQGILAADCGHLNAEGFPRIELHPALALAWTHAEGGGRFTLHVRASSGRDGDARRFLLAPLRATLSLPGLGARTPELRSFRWEWLLRRYSVSIDRTCVLGGNAGQQQERPLAHVDGGDDGEADRLNAVGTGAAGGHQSEAFGIRATPVPGGVQIEVWPTLDEDPPLLMGARYDLD